MTDIKQMTNYNTKIFKLFDLSFVACNLSFLQHDGNRSVVG